MAEKFPMWAFELSSIHQKSIILDELTLSASTGVDIIQIGNCSNLQVDSGFWPFACYSKFAERMEEQIEMEFTNQSESAAVLALGRLYELERLINSKTAGRIRQLQAESTGDSIVLSGLTTTYYAKQLATQIALDEMGLQPLENEIRVGTNGAPRK